MTDLINTNSIPLHGFFFLGKNWQKKISPFCISDFFKDTNVVSVVIISKIKSSRIIRNFLNMFINPFHGSISIRYTFWAQYIDQTVKPQLLFSFGTFDSFLAGLGRNRVYWLHVALPKRSINQFQPVRQSRQHVVRAYCSNIYAAPFGQSCGGRALYFLGIGPVMMKKY